MRPHGSPKELERRRLSAVPLFEQGCTNAEIARRLNVKPTSVARWRQRYQRGGAAALAAKPVPGRPTKLNGHQRRGLRQRLLKGAKANGFPTDLWTLPRVQRLIKRCYGVDYHTSHLSRLLHQLGFSPSEA